MVCGVDWCKFESHRKLKFNAMCILCVNRNVYGGII